MRRVALLKNICIAFMSLTMFLLLGGCNSSNKLTEQQQYAVDAIIDYREKVKDPSALSINHIYLCYSNDDTPEDYNVANLYLDVTGKNSLGGSNRNTVFYYIISDELLKEEEYSTYDKVNFAGSTETSFTEMKNLIEDDFRECASKDNELELKKIMKEVDKIVNGN